MADSLEIVPVLRPVRGTVRPPGSKSITNRALIVAALARGESLLTGVLDSDDTRVMIDSLRRLGLAVEQSLPLQQVRITGCGGMPPVNEAELWLENSGTSLRFLTAVCALGHGRFRLDGNSRMRERPIAPLIDALRQWGVDAATETDSGCPPVIVQGGGLPGGRVEISGALSSQYLSALLMAAPAASGPVTIQTVGALVSRPYVDMTTRVMQSFGVNVAERTVERFEIVPAPYTATDYAIEPDASAASYFFAAAAVTGGCVTVEGLSADSLQGDVHFAGVLEQMGCRVEWGDDSITVTGGPLRGVDIDMNAISDTAQTLAAVAPFAAGATRIRNVAHMRHKETDRVQALVQELAKLGLRVEEHADGLTIHPGEMHPASIATYNDHRMAMSFAVLGLRTPGVRIENPGCTAKTYPDFFSDLQRLCSTAR